MTALIRVRALCAGLIPLSAWAGLCLGTGCFRSKSEEAKPPPTVQVKEPSVSALPEPTPQASGDGPRTKRRRMRPLEKGPKPRPLSAPVVAGLAPQACLRVPTSLPLAALYRKSGPGGAEVFVFFKTEDGFVGHHTTERLVVSKAPSRVPGPVRQWDMVPAQAAGGPLPKGAFAKGVRWDDVRTPFHPGRMKNVLSGALGLVPRRCAEVQVHEGTWKGRTTTVHMLPGLDVPEAVVQEGQDTEQWVLMGFLNPSPYVALVARLEAMGE